MKLWTLQRLLGYVFKAIFMLLMVILFADVLSVVLEPLDSSYALQRPWQWQAYRDAESDEEKILYWRNIFLNDETSLISKKIGVSMEDGKANLDFILTIRSMNPDSNAIIQDRILLHDLSQGRVTDDVQNFVTAIFGVVEIENEKLLSTDYAIPVWEADSRTGITTVKVHASKNLSGFAYFSIDRSQSKLIAPSAVDEISFIPNGWWLRSITPSFLSASAEKILFVDQSASGPDRINAYLISPSVKWENGRYILNSSTTRTPFSSRQSFLQELPDFLNIPLVSSLLFCLIEALPLIAFLLILSKSTNPGSEHIETLVITTLAFLLFHFVVYSRGAVASLLYSTVIDRFSQWTSYYLASFWSSFSPYWITSALSEVEFVILAILLPAMFFQNPGLIEYPKKWTTLVIWLVSILLIVGSVTAPILYLSVFKPVDLSFDGPPLWIWISLGTGIISILMYVLFFGLYKNLTGHRPPSALIPSAVLLLLIIIIFDELKFRYDPDAYSQYVWLCLVVIFGANLFRVFLLNAYRPVKEMFQLPTAKSSYRVAGIFLVILLSIPLNKVVSPTREVAVQYDLSSLSYRLDNIIIFAWIALIVCLLYVNRRSDLQLSALTRQIGILLATSLVINYTSTWMYIPVNFIIGWFAFSYLVRASEYWNELQPFFGRVVSERQTLLEKIVTLNTAERSYQELHKQLSAKLASGAIGVAEFEQQLLKRRKDLDKRNSMARLNNQPIKELALAFGPYSSSWDNALHGAKWAAIFALPWVALGVREFLVAPMEADPYPLLSFLVNISSLLGKWIGLGFVFGYFYPYLRGQNGLQKGLRLFLTVVICALPLTILFNTTTTAWQASLFWMLQVFIQCMLLGLVAFDYMTLREGYRDWQMLFEVHGIPSIGLSVSSIVAAIGVTVVTLLTSQASNLVALALQYVLPQIPNMEQLTKTLIE